MLLCPTTLLGTEFWDDEKTVQVIVDEKYFGEDQDNEGDITMAMEQVGTLHLDASFEIVLQKRLLAADVARGSSVHVIQRCYADDGSLFTP